MPSVFSLLNKLETMDPVYTGPVDRINLNHWIVGGNEAFPIQIETLAQPERFIIYCTGVRETGAPIYTPLMKTQFLENLNGYVLGNYGICPGLVTMTVYQIITMKPDFSLDRMASEIVCHRMLTECFLESEFFPDDDWPKTVQDLEDNTPIIPFHH